MPGVGSRPWPALVTQPEARGRGRTVCASTALQGRRDGEAGPRNQGTRKARPLLCSEGEGLENKTLSGPQL